MLPDHVALNTTVHKDTKVKLQRIAAKRGWNLSMVVKEALNNYVKVKKD